MRMELEAENGSIIFIERGSKKQLGRGPGIYTNDQTVSRQQVLLELPDSEPKDGLNGSDPGINRLCVQVLGPNPICIVRGSKNVTKSLQETARPPDVSVVFLKKGESSWLSVGDKISLSIKLPVFFTCKENRHSTENEALNSVQRTESKAARFVLDKPVEPSEDKNEISDENANIIHEDRVNDLLTKWKARKKGKSLAKEPDRPNTVNDEGSISKQNSLEPSSKEEEEGIAEAVARRQRKAAERYQQEQQRNEKALTQEAADNRNTEIQVQVQNTQIRSQQIDPVKEFGFLLEGREFDQYDKNRRHNTGDWDWHIGRKEKEEDDDDEQEDDSAKGQHRTKERKRKSESGKSTIKGKGVKEEDEEWMGEDEEEEVKIRNLKVPKTSKKIAMRFQDVTSPAASSTRNLRGKQTDLLNATDTQDKDRDDETLGGFIVKDDEDEELNEDIEEEEEWSDDDEMEDLDGDDDDDVDDDGHESIDIKPSKKKKGQKPVCKYGNNCYRKNKKHMEQYQHPS